MSDSSLDSRQGWTVVAAVTAILTFTAGARLLPSIVLKSITGEFGWSRSEVMIAITINMVVLSALQPVLGITTDRVGPKRVFVGGCLLLGLVMLPLSRATHLWQFYFWYGVIGAVALAAVSPVNVTSLVSSWFVERRGAALSIATSGTAFGQLMMVPIGTWLLTTASWESLYLMLSLAILVLMTPIALFFVNVNRSAPVNVSSTVSRQVETVAGPALRLQDAISGSNFWTMAFGFFVCGFTMAFANSHFLAYADDMGMASTRAADVVAATGLFSIVGSFVLGVAADRYPRRHVLSMTYALRGLSFALLFFLPVGSLLFIYAVVLGISWTATTPLTAAIAADLYGRKNLGLIFGTMFSFMNIGYGAGSFLDGLVYDTFGSYRVALLANAALGALAAVAVLQVQHAVRTRPAVAPAIAEERREIAVAERSAIDGAFAPAAVRIDAR